MFNFKQQKKYPKQPCSTVISDASTFSLQLATISQALLVLRRSLSTVLPFIMLLITLYSKQKILSRIQKTLSILREIIIST